MQKLLQSNHNSIKLKADPNTPNSGLLYYYALTKHRMHQTSDQHQHNIITEDRNNNNF